MDSPIIPYKEMGSSKKEQVETMFNNIANRYDFLNQLLSFGIHKKWRKKAIQILRQEKPLCILDIATGTGDFAIEALALNPNKIIGIDISKNMLAIGREKLKKVDPKKIIELQSGDSENILFSDNSFDAITVAFGVRNFEQLEKGLGEMLRVLKPNGTAIVIEFSKPIAFPFKQLYQFYFFKILPFLGKFFSKDNSAYSYLPESVMAFPDRELFLNVLNKVGFKETSFQSLTFGVAAIYIGKK